jgi:hypothetical protein
LRKGKFAETTVSFKNVCFKLYSKSVKLILAGWRELSLLYARPGEVGTHRRRSGKCIFNEKVYFMIFYLVGLFYKTKPMRELKSSFERGLEDEFDSQYQRPQQF